MRSKRLTTTVLYGTLDPNYTTRSGTWSSCGVLILPLDLTHHPRGIHVASVASERCFWNIVCSLGAGGLLASPRPTWRVPAAAFWNHAVLFFSQSLANAPAEGQALQAAWLCTNSTPPWGPGREPVQE